MFYYLTLALAAIGVFLIAMVPLEKNWPAQLLLLTTLTLLTLEYGMLVIATRFPTNDLSWMITRRVCGIF